MSCAYFGLCVPLPVMPSYVWAKWRQPITTSLPYQLITSPSLLMLLTMLFPPRSHIPVLQAQLQPAPFFCDHTTSVFFLPRPIYARLLEITRQFSRPPFRYRLIDSIFAACLPLLLSVAVLTRHATKVIVFESELLLMQLRGECLRFVLGRGNSNAFLRYIQISSLSSTN